jgi:periplasmic divalent cation tolerance protein
MSEHRLVVSTAGSAEEARRIARALVEKRLAACVNIVPRIESVYHWKGNVEEAQEWLLLIKTTAAAFTRVCEAIEELHSYELSECICVAIEDGSAGYLKWMAESVKIS